MQRRGESGQPVKGQRTTGPEVRKVPTAHASIADLEERLDQRTRELDEALQQQTATSEVLGIIRRSPADAQPVFDAIVQSAARLCGAVFSAIFLWDGDRLRIAATKNLTPEAKFQFHELERISQPDRSTIGGRAILDRATVHVPDVLTDPGYSQELALAGGWRAVVGVPRLHEGNPVGSLTVSKAEPVPFSDRQIQLLQTFADQAAIAIENVRLFEAEQQRTRELSESLEQQMATSEVLKVISSSPGELGPVFQVMLRNAITICQATFGMMFKFSDGAFSAIASYGDEPAFLTEQSHVVSEHPHNPLSRMVVSKEPVHVADLRTEQAYLDRDPRIVAMVEDAGARTLLDVPMLKDGDSIGAILVYRKEVRAFTDKQIELVQNFAAQAVIAIENTRLLNELRQRTDDLSEALEQQTATSEVLKVISGSPSELKPVFDAILENATRICEAKFGTLWLREGDAFRVVALHNAPPAYEERRRNRLIPLIDLHPKSVFGRFLKTRQVTHIAYVRLDQGYLDGAPTTVDVADAAGARTVLMVPMLKDNELIGSITIYRQEVRLFADTQIELVKNFANQAVIAIENTRLLNELRESLQQQTATADVLKVISRSTFDLQTVLDTLLDSAIGLCGTERGMIFRYDGDSCRAVAARNFPREFLELWERTPIRAGRGTTVGRALLERRPIQIVDVKADPEYAFDEAQKMFAFRTVLAVPMLREGTPKGVIGLVKTEVEPFTDKQIALVETFADQAAIAIENVRLFESVEARTRELAASLQNLRATQDRLVQTQKLASLGQLTAGIAHEIKNPLNFVNNFSAVSAELIDELQETLKGIPF